jgi:hypothetical protein
MKQELDTAGKTSLLPLHQLHEFGSEFMNDAKLTFELLDSIYKEARKGDLSFAERAGLYAALRTIIGDIEEHIDDYMEGHGYAHEKAVKVAWHLGAALGFDVTNSLGNDQHLSSALGDIGILRDLLKVDQP